MKASQIITVSVAMLLGATGIYYSLQQKDTMAMLTNVHGGMEDKNAASESSLLMHNQQLESEFNTAAGKSSDAVKLGEDARMADKAAQGRFKQASAEYQDWKSQCAEAKRQNKALEEKVTELRTNIRNEMESLATSSDIDFSDMSEDLSAVVEKVRTFVQEQKDRAKQLDVEWTDKKTARKAAQVRVANTTKDLNNQTTINAHFFNEYCKNREEFSILAVDPRWRYIVFHAGKESGLSVGQTQNGLLVKDGDNFVGDLRIISIQEGMVVAEYPSTLKMTAPRVGDTVFRWRPIGE